MKKFVFISCLFFSAASVVGQNKSADTSSSKTAKMQVVEAACGQCRFGMPGKDCDLAVRIDGKAYFVDGTNIDDHGDAHAKDGFCQAIRKAEVAGQVVDNRFKATHFKLVPAPKPAPAAKPAGK
jgi:hypothetical protein